MSRKEQYKSLAILSLGWIFIGWYSHHMVIICLICTVALAGIISPFLLKSITLGWQWIGETIGGISSGIILTCVYLLVLTPIAIFYRLGKKKSDTKPVVSNYITRNHKYIGKDLEQIF